MLLSTFNAICKDNVARNYILFNSKSFIPVEINRSYYASSNNRDNYKYEVVHRKRQGIRLLINVSILADSK
jgi:hypothetical protein